MEFFRKYQRVILYTAGIFALVSFSISAPILGFFESLFRKQVPMPTMRIGDRIVQVTAEDLQVASQVAMLQRFLPSLVMPNFIDQDEDEHRRDVYAALRRLAITFGIEPSADEVQKAVAQTVEIAGAESVVDLARAARSASVGEFERGMAEALRIGIFVRLQALTADTSDASLIRALIDDVELLVVEVATLDEEAIEKEIEAEDVTDEALQEWIAGLEGFDQRSRGYVGEPRYDLQVPYLELASFDQAAYAAELEGKEFSDDEVDNYYVLNRAALFLKPTDDKDGEQKEGEQKEGDEKNGDEKENQPDDGGEQEAGAPDGTPQETEQPVEEPADADQEPTDADAAAAADQDPYRPLDDELRAEIRRRLAAEAVMRALWDQVQDAYRSHLQPALDAVEAAQLAVEEKQTELAAAAERADAEGATEEDRAARVAAETAVEEAKAAVTTAEEALAARRTDFDARAAFETAAAGRPGTGVVDTGGEPKTTAELGELEPMAPWRAVVTVTEEQPLSTQVQRSRDAVFHLRWRGAEMNPLRPFDEIRDKARADYFTQRAEEVAEERAEAFEKTLDELARARVQEQITKLEQERDEKVQERMDAWRADLEQKLQEARQMLEALGDSDPQRRVFVAAKDRVARLETDLERAEAQRESILEEEQAAIDTKIEELAKEQYGAVLAEAAGQHGFVVAEFGPLPRDLDRRGAPRESYPKPVAYLFWSGNTRELDKGDATDLLVDFTGRARHLAVVKDVVDGGIENITRRQLMEARRSRAPSRRVEAAMQSFTLDALKVRYGWQAPAEAVTEPK